MVAASASWARASSSGPSRTVPGPSSAKKSATAASATLLAAAPSTRVKARIASSPNRAAPCSKAAMNEVRSAGTSVSLRAGMPAANRTRMTRGAGQAARAATSVTVTMSVRPWVTRSLATPGSVPMRWALTICSRVAPCSVRYSQKRQPLGAHRDRPGHRGRRRARRPPDPPVHCIQARVADSCARAMPLSRVSRWPSKVNSPDPWTSCSDREDTRIFAGAGGVGQPAGHDHRVPEVGHRLRPSRPRCGRRCGRRLRAVVGGNVGVEGALDVDGTTQGAGHAAERHHEAVALHA